jgi:hypothetical protein
MGRFSHSKDGNTVFIFSSSDNSDPNTNGRIYKAEKRPAASEPQLR